MRPAWSFAILLPLALLAPRLAAANCAQPVGYNVTEAPAPGGTNGTVRICSESFGGRKCPDPGGLLRENVATGEVVRLPDRCDGDGEEPCWIDVCVPAGTYRYGLADPYDCYSSSCGTYYWEEIEVTGAPGACTPDDGSGTTPVAATPWGENRTICDYGGTDEDDPTGCSVASTPVVPAAVFGLNLLVAAIALRARRRR